MPVIPFSSAPRIARDAQAAADLREQQAAEEGRRYREAADAKLKELKAKGVKKFDPNAGSSPISIPEPLEPGGFRINAPGVETPDPYRIAESSPDWNAGDEAMGSGGPENPVNDPALASIAEQMIARQKERASYSLTAGLMQSTATPDQAAADVETAGKAGVSRVQVEADRKTFALKVQQDEFDKLSNESPLTYSWLTQDYDNLEVAKDDHQNLSWWESIGSMVYNTPGALWSSAVKFGESTLGVTQMGVDAGDELGRSPSPALAAIFGNPNEANRIARDLNARASGGTLPQDPNSPLAMASRAINTPRMSLREYADAVMPQGRNDIERGYYSGIVSLGQNAPLIIASAITKNPSIMTLGMTGTTAGEAYSRATDEHPELTYGERAAYALTQAGIEFLTEVGPNALFVEALLKGSIKEQVKGFAKQQLVEQFGEQTATAFQDMNDWLTLKPEATWEDYLKERPSAALQTFVATLVAGGGQVAIGKASDAVGQKLDAANQQKRAEDLANFVRAMGDNAKDSKLLKRLPDKYREAVAAVTKDGPRENIRINPEGIAELAQSQNVTPEQLAQAFRIDPETMVQAMDSGDDIVVPSGNFAAVIQTAKKDIGVSGETIYQALAPHIRLNANDFTAKESEAFQKVAKAEADARAEWNTTENDFAASSEQVETDIRDQIRATGRFNEDTVDGQAKLMGQLVNVIAKQTGQDPAEVWKNDGFNIMSAVTGEQADEGSTLPQGSPRTANPPSDFDLKWAAEDLEEKQFEAWKAAREGLSNPQIADRMNAAEEDAVYTPADVSKWLQLARRQGYDSELASKHVKAPETERIIKLRAKGWKNADIARSVYPDVATDVALNRVKALASKNKAKIEERKAALEGKVLAQGEGDFSYTFKVDTKGWQVTRKGYDAAGNFVIDPNGDGAFVSDASGESIGVVPFANGKSDGQIIAEMAAVMRPDAANENVDPELIKAMLGSIDDLESRPDPSGPPRRQTPLKPQEKARARWGMVDKPILTVFGSELAHGGKQANATIALGRTRALIKMFEGANLSSLAHEGAHWYLDLLFRMSKASAKSFRTSKGSTYEIGPNGATTRNKAYRPEHGEAEQGAQPTSDVTFYVTKEQANLLGEIQTQGDAKRVIAQLPDGRWGIRYEDGKDAGKFEKRTIIAVQSEPAVGLTPIELWKGGSRVHFGNDIVSVDSAHPFVTAQMARILEFAGHSQEWGGMFDAKGDFTEEGRKLQEQFAEAFEVHLMTGKAPSVGMRSVLNTFKQWLLGVYKAYRKGIDQSVRDVGPYTRARIDAYEKATGKKLTGQALFAFVVPQELRDVFDRMLATEDAINAAQTTMIRDSEAMSKAMLEKLDPEGKWKPERQQKFMDRMRERYAEAKERAEAALMARLMEEHTRNAKAVESEEYRDLKREVASEIDERPEQRAYQILSGEGYRDTRADHAEAQADAADVMATLAQMVSTEQRQAWQLERGAVDDTPYFFGTYSAGALGDIENYDLSKAGSQSGSGERAMFLTTSSKRANTYADPGMSSADGYFTKEEDPARWEKVRAFLGGASVSDAAVRGYISRSVDAPGVFKAYVRGPVRDVDWQEYTGSVTFDDEAMKRLIDEETARPEGPRNLRITNIADGGNDHTAVNMVVLDPDNVMNAISSSRADDAGSSLAQSQTHDPKGERELDALGFYSAVFEAAKSVRPDVWSMGWDHARNSIVKGGAKINGQRVAPRESEMAYLGLDEMFYGTKLKGAELAEAVLSHIQAKRLLLVENFARLDPNENAKAPAKAAMLDEIDDDTLSLMLGVEEISYGYEAGPVTAFELDGAERLETGLFVQPRNDLKAANRGLAYFDLFRVLDGGKREVITTGVLGNVRGVAARIIANENRSRVMRKISAETMAEYWHQSRDGQPSRTLVRGPGDIRLPGEDVPLFESVIGLPEGVPGSDYQAPRSHVGGKAKGTLVTAHGEERIDDKGQRTLFTGQVQSDMAQSAREEKEAGRNQLLRVKSLRVDEMYDGQYWLMDTNDNPIIGPFENRADGEAALDQRIEQAQLDQNKFDAPLLSTSEWTNVGVRAMVYRAARDGFASVSFPTSETSEIIQGNDTAAGHYDTNVRGALEKIGKQLGGEVRKGWVWYGQSQEEQLQLEADQRRYLIQLRPLYEERKKLVSAIQAENDDPEGPDFGVIANAEQDLERLEERIGELEAYAGITENNSNLSGEASAYVLDITPAMRAKIVSEGFPLFQTRTGKDRIAQPASIPAMRLNLDAVREQYGEEAVAALPPAVRAYSTEATDADQFIQQARTARQTLKKKHPKSLWQFFAGTRRVGEGNDKISYKGLRDENGDLTGAFYGEGPPEGLIVSDQEPKGKTRAYTLRDAIYAAWEEGYFDGSPPSLDAFIAALKADISGAQPLYRRTDMPLVDEIRNAEQWAAWFDENGIDITEKDQAVLKAQIETKLSGQSENAIGPDEAAPFFGMSDGKALLEGLKQGPMRDKLIREETKRRMTERHGDTFSDGRLMEEANAYARNEIQHRQFEIELEALADAAGQRAQANLAKQTAIDNLRSKQVREVLNYNQWLTLSERWGKKAVEAAGKGDMAKAMEFARFRLINSHMYTEGKKLAEKIEKTRTHLLDYGKKTKQARLFAAGAEYQANMNGLLDDYQFRNESKKGESQRAARGAWIKAQMAGIDPWAAYKDPTKTPAEQQVAAAEQIEKSTLLAELGEGVDARNYKSITVEELLAVKDEADLIWRLATLKDRLLKEGERRRIGLAAEDMAASVIANQPKAREPEGIESNLRGEKLKRGVDGVLSAHRTLQSLIREMDGGKNGGVLWRYLIKPLNAAFAHKSTLMKQAGTEVAKLFEVFSNKEISRFAKDRQTLTLRAKDGSTAKVTLTTQGRLAIALNAGNEKNRARLMDSNGWDEAQLQQVLDTLDKRSWDWVQSIWDYLNTWFPEANRVHEAVHGAPMDKVASLPVATRFGIYAGGYFPIRYDANRSSKSGQRALEKDAQAGGAGRVGVRTKEGFTKSRVEGKVTLPLLLDPFMVIMSHLDEVTTSIATEETLFDVGRLAMRSEFQDAVVERHGRVRYNEIIEVLKAAKFGLQGPRGVIEGIMNHVRNGSTVAKLGWNLKTALLQPAGFSNSAVRIGSTWLLRGYGKMIGSGVKMQGWGKWAIDKSEFMRHRRDHQSPEQVNLLATLKGNKPLVVAQRSVYQLMAQTQFFGVDVPTFIGMYDRAIAEGATDEDAVAQAEQAVIDAQGGGEVFQTAGIQRGSVPMRLWTNLMSYMITTYNLSAQRLAQKDPNALAKITRLTGDMLLLWSVPVAATMFITYVIQQALSGGGDDDDEYWSAENMAREQLSFLMGPFFGLSQVAGAVKTDPFEYRGPAGADIITQGYKAMDAASHGEVLELLRPANQVAGMIFHLPANQIDKSVRGTLALWNGETNNPAAIFFGPPPKN